MRRGFEYKVNNRYRTFIPSWVLFNIKNSLKLESSEIENNISLIKSGRSGRIEKVEIPCVVDLSSERPESVKKALAEFVYSNIYEKELNQEIPLPFFFSEKDFIVFDLTKIEDRLKIRLCKMKRQGMKPKFKINQNQVIFEYRMLGTNKRTKKIIPLYITIDQDFSKEFGKWLGDRAGGPHKVGVSNKNFDFVLSFRKFLINKIDQPESEIKINLTYNPKFKVPRKLMNKVDKMIVTKTQLGNYSFSVISSNKPLRDFVFDIIEKYWHVILKNSKECARYGYYAGLFEADGSIDIKYPCWSFGLNLNSSSETRILPKLNECIRLKNLLKLDGFDPLISRKISKTQNSYTLKYDLRIFRTKDKIREYKLFKEKILPNITHKEKISKFKMIRGDNFQ